MAFPIKVLIVDDNEDARAVLRYSMQYDNRFHVVGEAYDGRSALRMIEMEKPDVVVLDLMMPTMDGFHAIPQIKISSPETKIVVYSGADVGTMGLEYQGAHAVHQKGESINTFLVTETLVAVCAE